MLPILILILLISGLFGFLKAQEGPLGTPNQFLLTSYMCNPSCYLSIPCPLRLKKLKFNWLYTIQGNLGLMNLKEQKIFYFIEGVLLLLVLFTMELTTKGLEIKLFVAAILLLMGSLY
jgi:hypothetical protein